MPSPKIGKRTITEVKDQQADEIIKDQHTLDSINATPEERELGSVAAVLEQRTRALEALRPRVAETPREPTATLLDRFLVKSKDADTAALEARREEARKHEGGLVAEARSLLTKFGLAQRKYQSRVETAAAQDFAALRRSIPEDLQMVQAGDRFMLVSRNHEALRRFQVAAEDARGLLRSQMSGVNQGNDVDAPDVAGAADAVARAIESGQTHDSVHGVLGGMFRRAVVVLRFHVEKARRLVESSEEACKRFDKADSTLREILASITPKDQVEAAPLTRFVPKLPERQQKLGGSSFCDFDARELDREGAR